MIALSIRQLGRGSNPVLSRKVGPRPTSISHFSCLYLDYSLNYALSPQRYFVMKEKIKKGKKKKEEKREGRRRERRKQG